MDSYAMDIFSSILFSREGSIATMELSSGMAFKELVDCSIQTWLFALTHR